MEAKRPFSDADWENTPAPVKEYVGNLERQVNELTSKVDLLFKRVEELENRINKNSSNSNKPPSSDPPYKRPKKKVKKSKQKRGAQKGHKGHRQTVLDPTDTILPVGLSLARGPGVGHHGPRCDSAPPGRVLGEHGRDHHGRPHVRNAHHHGGGAGALRHILPGGGPSVAGVRRRLPKRRRSLRPLAQ